MADVIYTNDKYADMKKNTVSAANQLKPDRYTRIYNSAGKGKRILLLGNSITLHGVLESIGWTYECGMAASSPEKDYVHLLMSKIQKENPDAVIYVCQVSQWEINYKKPDEVFEKYSLARDFNADIIVARFIENCSSVDFDKEIFKDKYCQLIDFFNSSGKADIILTTGFWMHPGDDGIKEIGTERNLPVIYLGDLGADDKMKAIGLFEHNGVANHPGDAGMEAIADRIWAELATLI